MPYKRLRQPTKSWDFRKTRESIDKKKSQLSRDLQINLDEIKNIVGKSSDIVIRQINIDIGRQCKAAIFYIDGMVDKVVLNNSVMDALMVDVNISKAFQGKNRPVIQTLMEEVLTNIDVSTEKDFVFIMDDVFSGDTALMVDGEDVAIIIRARNFIGRAVEEPTTEVSITSPKEAFTETLRINTALIRHKLKSPKLKMDYYKLGVLTKTDVVVAYIAGVANQSIVDEVIKRIKRVETDGILSAEMVYEFIEDNPWALFPQGQRSERSDRVAAHLLEGGVAIIVDGTPFVIMVPYTFWQFLSSHDDYNERVYISFFIRFLRITAMVLSLILPSFYIAVTTFHQEMIPTAILQTIINARRGVPYPALVEALVMELIIELVREAGVRLPRNVGQAISIVGALVLGTAAIQAKLASSIMVVVVASTAVASFTMPSFSTAIALRILRFPLMFAAAFLGLFGLTTGLFFILVHAASLRSFGVPFLAPVAPFYGNDMKDSQIRLPVWMQSTRNRLFRTPDPVRQENNLKPEPPGFNPNRGGTDDA